MSKSILFLAARRRWFMASRPELHGCGGCASPTWGAVSESTGTFYACCPDCCERVDAAIGDDDDRGPYRERLPLPTSPCCGAASWAGFQCLECLECGQEWVPKGIYAESGEVLR